MLRTIVTIFQVWETHSPEQENGKKNCPCVKLIPYINHSLAQIKSSLYSLYPVSPTCAPLHLHFGKHEDGTQWWMESYMFTIDAQPLESLAMAVLGLFPKREHLLNSITQVRKGQGIHFTKCIRGSTCVSILELKKS